MSIVITITNEQRTNLLTSALEGGSNYWYYLYSDATKIINKHKKAGDCFVDKMWRALENKEEIPVRDKEDMKEVLGKISLASIEKAEQIMAEKYPEHFADIMSGSDDAATGDLWFQLSVMGDVVYG